MPNFSEGRDRQLIGRLAEGPLTLDVHADADHNRSVVTMAAGETSVLVDAVFEKARLAVERIDLRAHSGVHPRVGAADVLPIVPLGEAAMEEAAVAARRLGERIWRELGVPVCFYGILGGGRTLADIRAGRAAPDLGGPGPHPTAGVACVGARPPLVAYNLVFPTLDLAAVREVARSMRRLPGVQALAFALGDGTAQLSMNLTRPDEVTAATAYAEAGRLGGVAGRPELVGLCPAAAAGPGCDGGLLEARLAAAAASRAATAARAAAASGGPRSEEMLRLGERFEAAAARLAPLEAGAVPCLAGAEQAEALIRVLRAAQLETASEGPILRVASTGLLAAVDPETATAEADRIELLERWRRESPN